MMDKEKRKQEIKRMFALADKDKDGKLSVAEWEQMLVQAGAPADKKEVEKFFAERDRDFDGSRCSSRRGPRQTRKKLRSFSPKETGILMGDSHLRNFSEKKHKLRNYSDSWIKIRMASSLKR